MHLRVSFGERNERLSVKGMNEILECERLIGLSVNQARSFERLEHFGRRRDDACRNNSKVARR